MAVAKTTKSYGKMSIFLFGTLRTCGDKRRYVFDAAFNYANNVRFHSRIVKHFFTIALLRLNRANLDTIIIRIFYDWFAYFFHRGCRTSWLQINSVARHKLHGMTFAWIPYATYRHSRCQTFICISSESWLKLKDLWLRAQVYQIDYAKIRRNT